MRFSPRTGLSLLETIRVSRSSADQRSGRAGRTPGVCYRLWMPEEDRHLVDRAPPEILESDLASAMLDLAAAGVGQPSALRWIDVPPAPAVAQARQLLQNLAALLQERDILRRVGHRPDVDMRSRIVIVADLASDGRHDVDRDALRRVRE